jgi:predicted nucleotidyltransferase
MKSFLTGSRVYGTPRPDSDIDLVVLVDDVDLQKLCDMVATTEDRDTLGAPGGIYYEDGTSLRFGRLNLLCVTEKKHFDVWQFGTERLKEQKPVTRDFAIEFLKKLRHDHEVSGW